MKLVIFIYSTCVTVWSSVKTQSRGSWGSQQPKEHHIDPLHPWVILCHPEDDILCHLIHPLSSEPPGKPGLDGGRVISFQG